VRGSAAERLASVSARDHAIGRPLTEWHLLEVLVRHPGKLLTQRQLLTEVWGPGYETAHGNLRLYIAQLRRKLEPDPSRPRFLRTEPGMGYRFQPRPAGEGGHE
jgi:two-component system KDP operon response regulator KdpE